MRSVNIAELKNNLSRYLGEVRRGSEVVVKDRNKPIAKIVPLPELGDDEAELSDLIAQGIVLPPKTTSPLPKAFWTEPMPEASVDLIALIREDRDAR